MEVLNEQLRQTLFEDVKSESKGPGILRRVKGCISDFKKNRNGRVYPRELWENVINSEYVNEMINSKSLFGEADHPVERNEISIQNISHAINKMWIDDEKEEVWAELDILDTPLGQLVSHLIEYGTKIGVSSRGAGEVTPNGYVDPDTYKFFTIDIVARPSCAAARPSIVESEEVKMLSESELMTILDSYKGLKESSAKTNSSKYSYMINGVKKTI